MASELVTALVAAAGVVGALGVLIKYFGMGELIAGYDPDRVGHEEALAVFVGTNTLYVAALILLVAAVEYADLLGGSEAIWFAFIGGVLGLTVRTVRGVRRYEKPA